MARLRNAPGTQASAPPATSTAKPTRQALKEKTNTARTKTTVYENDGHPEGLVKDAPRRRGRPKKATQNEDEYVMAGGLGKDDSSGKPAEGSDQPLTTDELAKSDGPPLPTAKAGRRAPRTTRKAVQSEAQSKVMAGMKERMQATAHRQAAAAVKSNESAEPSSDNLPTKLPTTRKSTHSAAERSDFSLSPSPPPPGNVNTAKKQRSSFAQPGSALRSQGTPAVESSILALKNFKRRPRQPSMLQMVQQRTASARPSAVHTQATEDLTGFDLDVSEDEEFAPEAEGTPLHAQKAGKRPNAKEDSNQAEDDFTPAMSSRKRKSDGVDHSSSALDALKAKRQKSAGPLVDEPLPAFGEGSPVRRTPSAREATPPPPDPSEVQVINSSPSTTPSSELPSPGRRQGSQDSDVEVPSTEREQDVPLQDQEIDRYDVVDGTMADPASSSPLPATQRTDIMADPLTQVSPPRPQRDKSKKAKKEKAMTTATLQSLLPKRRRPLKHRHRKSEYDMDSESDDDLVIEANDEEDDELSGTLRRRTTKAAQAKGKKGPAKSKSRQSKAAPTRKSTAPHTRKSKAPAKKTGKTYGRATASDKENEGDAFESLDENDDSALPDTSMSSHDAAQSTEIEAARKKFAAIDEWDMEFESMSFEEHRSSSQQWR